MNDEANFDAVWLLERVGMDVEKLMREQRLTRAGLVARLAEAGAHVSREWVDKLIRGEHSPDSVELGDLSAVFFALRQRAQIRFDRL